MPYVSKVVRDYLDSGGEPVVAGELNYCLTKLVCNFVRSHGGRYEVINSAIGALECAKLELYRRIASPYEDTKIQENGDVY